MENKQRELFMHSKVTKKNKSRRTVAGIVDYDNSTITIGVSQCSRADTFLKEKGRMISLARANKKPVEKRKFDITTENPIVIFKEMAVAAIANNDLQQWHTKEKV